MPTQIIFKVGPRPPCPPSAGAHGVYSTHEIAQVLLRECSIELLEYLWSV